MRLGFTHILQRFGRFLALGLALGLSACGGVGTKYQEFFPNRLVVIGDEISYVGCIVNNGVCQGTDTLQDRYTVNYDSTAPGFLPFLNNWVVNLARLYGLTVDKVIESAYVAPGAADRRATRKGATAAAVRAQADGIPAYQTGDLLIIAGGANDILCVVRNTDTSKCSSTTVRPGIDPNKTIASAKATSLGNDKALRIIAAAHAYQQLALDMIGRGHRNIFVVPVYDFSNSPDLNNFCPGCSASELNTATTLFNIALRAFTDGQGTPLTFSPGQPRILLTTGVTASDAQYVNITQFTLVPGSAVYNYALSPSICGTRSTVDFARDNCSWNGLFLEGNGYTPYFNGTANPDALGNNRALFLTNLGRSVYTADFYLSPFTQASVGGIFYSFMRGFQGW